MGAVNCIQDIADKVCAAASAVLMKSVTALLSALIWEAYTKQIR